MSELSEGQELIPINEGTGALMESPISRRGIVDYAGNLERQVAAADKYFQLHDHIRKRAISLTNYLDWTSQDGKPYLMETGTEKIEAAFNICQENVFCQRERESDDRGDYITYTWTASLVWNGRAVSCIGTSSTRDKFFGRKDNKDLPLSEIDLMNVKKKGWTNLMNRGIKHLLGLTFTWEEIEEHSDGKITKEKCTAISRTKGGQGGKGPETPAVAALREKIWNTLLELTQGDIGAAQNMLKELTKYGTSEGKTRISYCSEVQLKYLEGKIKAKIDAVNKELDKQAAGK
jgi:hypothetical protein